MAQVQSRSQEFGFEVDSFSTVHWVALLLAAITGVVHLYLFWSEGFVLFLLGGLGFFGAIALDLFNVYRRYLYLVGIPYTLVFVVGWLAQGMPNFWLGVFDKTVEVALIVSLAYLYLERRGR